MNPWGHLIHGFAPKGKKPPEYKSWCEMRQRCLNPKNHKWKYYGGRGIRVCRQWRGSFIAFFLDMGFKPSPQHSLDRINNNGHYTPKNCRWATYLEQRHNSRGVRLTPEMVRYIRSVYKGRGKSISQYALARQLGVARTTITWVVSKGTWSHIH